MGNKYPCGTSQLGKRDYLIRISVSPRNFPVGWTKKGFKPFTSQQEFPGICGKWWTNFVPTNTRHLWSWLHYVDACFFCFFPNYVLVSLHQIKTLWPLLFGILKKKENSNTRKLRKIFRAPGENQTHNPASSSSDDPTTDIIFLCLISTVHWAVQGRFSTTRPCGTCFVWSAECCCNPSHRTSTPGAHCQVMFISPF